jgi:2-C-methyl-D-erythritol 4-phosphate cytidylyltransferase
MNAYAIVLGGGTGTRMGIDLNKVLMPLRGIPAIVRAIAPFTGLCAGVVVVARAEELELMQATIRRYGLARAVLAVVAGGADRQASVDNGLAALPEGAQAVLIHDGARALVTEAVVSRVLHSVEAFGSGVAAVPVTDTIKRATAEGIVTETLERSQLYAMQTPQGFRVADIRAAHGAAAAAGHRATDDAALLEFVGLPVHLVEGSRENIKLTTPFDLCVAEAILTVRDGEAEL